MKKVPARELQRGDYFNVIDYIEGWPAGNVYQVTSFFDGDTRGRLMCGHSPDARTQVSIGGNEYVMYLSDEEYLAHSSHRYWVNPTQEQQMETTIRWVMVGVVIVLFLALYFAINMLPSQKPPGQSMADALSLLPALLGVLVIYFGAGAAKNMAMLLFFAFSGLMLIMGGIFVAPVLAEYVQALL